VDYRFLGASGLQVSTFSFGTMTLGGEGRFAAMGNVQVEEARRLVEICLDAGVNLFDTADIYSNGRSEEVLGGRSARTGRRSFSPLRFLIALIRARTRPDSPAGTSSKDARTASADSKRTTSTSISPTVLIRTRRWKETLRAYDD